MGRADQHHWLTAYNREIKNIEETGNLIVVERPKHVSVIQILELFVTKYNNILNEFKAKCRIMVQGDTKPDHPSFFSPVANIVSFRVFLIFALTFDTTIYQLDVSNAFLYGSLPKPVYLELPVGRRLKDGKKRF